jgi:hypothetical protein
MTPLIVHLDTACPGYVPGPYAEGLAYIWMSGFVRHVIKARLDGREAEVRAVFAVIERQLETDRPGFELSDDSNLAVAGFLEDMQNGNLHGPGSRPADFRAYLGPRSLERWEGLNGFWGAVEHSKGLR